MIRVAVVQMRLSTSMRKNRDNILLHIDKAHKRKADIVCFPEVSLQSEYDISRDPHEDIKKIKERCKERSIHCIFGSYLPYRGKLKNSLFLIDDEGNILYRYDKIHLWKDEKGKVIPGKRNKVVKTKLGKIAMIDCWDFAFSEYSRSLARKGAKIIFCPSYLVSHKKDGEVLRKIPLVKAFENISYYISCDAFSKETLSESFICHPGKILKHIKGKEGMMVSDVDLSEIDKLRKEYDHL